MTAYDFLNIGFVCQDGAFVSMLFAQCFFMEEQRTSSHAVGSVAELQTRLCTENFQAQFV